MLYLPWFVSPGCTLWVCIPWMLSLAKYPTDALPVVRPAFLSSGQAKADVSHVTTARSCCALLEVVNVAVERRDL